LKVFREHARDEIGKMLSNGAEEIGSCGIRDRLDVEFRKLDDGAAKLVFGDSEGDLLLVFELVKKASQFRCDLALDNARNFLQRTSSAIEFYKLLVFDPTGGWSAFRQHSLAAQTYSLTILSTVDKRSVRLSSSRSFLSAALNKPYLRRQLDPSLQICEADYSSRRAARTNWMGSTYPALVSVRMKRGMVTACSLNRGVHLLVGGGKQ
jgi:hypothetical protein